MVKLWFKIAFVGLFFSVFFGSLVVQETGAQTDTAVATPTPNPTPDPRFGAIESFWAPQEAAELDVGWERILFYWNEIQPFDGDEDDWNTLHVLEEWLDEAKAQDRTIVGLLKNTPAWATDGKPFSGIPRGLYLEVDDPDNLWANYVRRIVEYYGPRGVHHWIIWNEPEIGPGVYGHEFDGTVRDYYRLLKVAYLVAKEHDPEAVIHLAGYSYWHDPTYLRQFLQVALNDPEGVAHNYFFDTFSLHIYFRVETVRWLVEEVDRVQNGFGLDKPIWINETNASPNLDPGWPVRRPNFQVDLDQQAWYVVQATALGYGSGADSIAIYKLIDILLPEFGESFGILRPDYSKRPAYLAYKTTIRHLRDFYGEVQMQEADDYYIISFNTPRGVTRVLWARLDTAVTLQLPALAETAALISATGEEQSLTAVDDAYEITLHGARCRDECQIGGPPLFLVEEDVAITNNPPEIVSTPLLATLTATPGVTATFTPWPTVTPTFTPTLTPTATFTPSPTPSSTLTPTPTLTPSPTPTTQLTATAVPSPFPNSLPDELPSENRNVGLLWVVVGVTAVALLAGAFVRRTR